MGKLNVNIFSESVPAINIIANVITLANLIVFIENKFVVNIDPKFLIIPRVHLPELEFNLNSVMGW